MPLDEVMREGIVDGRVARSEIEFAVDGAQVRMDGTRADDQRIRDLGIRQSLRQQAQYLFLPPGKVRGKGWRKWN